MTTQGEPEMPDGKMRAQLWPVSLYGQQQFAAAIRYAPQRDAAVEAVKSVREAARNERDELREQNRELETQLQRISDWCEAYPLDVFTEPDMEQVRRLLGDTLLTQLSAHNFRHVLDGIKGIIAPQSGGK